MDEFQFSRDHHVTAHFRKKSLFFRDTRDHSEHDAKNRLSLHSPSPEKPLAEIDELKNNRPKTVYLFNFVISNVLWFRTLCKKPFVITQSQS